MKETLIKTSYEELREEIVLSPVYYIFVAQHKKWWAEKQKEFGKGLFLCPGREQEQIVEGGSGRDLP